MPGFNISKHGIVDPKSINNKIEFHRNHRWIVMDPGIPGMPPVERLYAKSIQLPSLTFDEETIKSGATVDYKIAKKAKWQDFTIKFYDVHGLYYHYKKWQDKIWTPRDGIGVAAGYKNLVILVLTDGEGNTKQTYTAHGAYPKSVTHGELSYENSDVKLLTVAYSYDYAEVKFEDVGSGGTPTGGSISGGNGPRSLSGMDPALSKSLEQANAIRAGGAERARKRVQLDNAIATVREHGGTKNDVAKLIAAEDAARGGDPAALDAVLDELL